MKQIGAMIGLFSLIVAVLAATPGTVASVQAQTDEVCFPETGYCMSGRIRQYWERYGGLPVFGFPISEQREEMVEGQTLTVQWFERNRLELHPQNPRPYDVLIGRIGVERLTQQSRNWEAFPRATEQREGCRFFPETGQNVCGEILSAWRANGLELDGVPGFIERENLAFYGLPVSPLIEEELNGRIYQVQWFERARFELHPENAPPFNVLLGLLGKEVLTSAPTGTSLTINARGDDLAFDQERIRLPAGSEVSVRFNNTASFYLHNWVLLNTNDLQAAREFNDAAGRAGRANQFLPADRSLVLAATNVLDAGVGETVQLTTPQAGDYLYICTVPGHFAAGMYGILEVR